MRTKVLICAAALAAASAFTSIAQNVYSLNVVGYINIPLIEGFQMVANQLDYDGSGTNNTDSNVLGTNLPLGTVVYTWNGSSYNTDTYSVPKGQTTASWQKNYPLNPGEGAWLSIPAGKLAGTSSNLTLVGTVDQGAANAVNPYLAKGGGFSLVSSIVPIAGGISSVLNYTPALNDQVFQWSISQNQYVHNSYIIPKGQTTPKWNPAEPSIGVGEGFWLDSGATSVWSNYFTVQ